MNTLGTDVNIVTVYSSRRATINEPTSVQITLTLGEEKPSSGDVPVTIEQNGGFFLPIIDNPIVLRQSTTTPVGGTYSVSFTIFGGIVESFSPESTGTIKFTTGASGGTHTSSSHTNLTKTLTVKVINVTYTDFNDDIVENIIDGQTISDSGYGPLYSTKTAAMAASLDNNAVPLTTGNENSGVYWMANVNSNNVYGSSIESSDSGNSGSGNTGGSGGVLEDNGESSGGNELVDNVNKIAE